MALNKASSMQITIEYQSSWRNIFSDGTNDEPVGQNGRPYIASGKNLNDLKKSTYKEADVTKQTVRGILNRIIGERRKLYQIANSDNNYFGDIDDKISFKDKPSYIDNEIVYLRNLNNSKDQNAFSGYINTDDPAFKSTQGKLLWGVLKLSFDEAVDYIKNRTPINEWDTSPLDVFEQFESVTDSKLYKNINYEKDDPEVVLKYKNISEIVALHIKDSKNTNSNTFSFKCFYADLIKIRLKFLEEDGYDFSNIKTKQGKLSGINPSGITFKDFIKKYTSGDGKTVYGNPYVVTKGSLDMKGKALKKVSGTLEITIDVDRKRAREIKELIENAGVLSFKVGKKSVAYIKKIKV